MNDKKVKRNKKIKTAVAVLFVCLIILPIGWHYAIGPRMLNNSPSPQEQLLYYKFHTYVYTGADCPDEWGACIRPGLLEGYYKSKGSNDYVIYSVLHDTFAYKRIDKIDNPYKKVTNKTKPVFYKNDSLGYIDYNGDKYRYLVTNDLGIPEYSFSIYSKLDYVDYDGKELGIYRLEYDYQLDYICVSDIEAHCEYVFTKTDMTEDKLKEMYGNGEITGYSMSGSFNTSVFERVEGNEQIVLDALTRLKNDENVKMPYDGSIDSNGHMSFLLKYNDIPISVKDKMFFRFADGELYYYPDDMSPDMYLITDDEIKNVLMNIFE